ncbi:MAG TPA: LLM class flavin-dependent oxidoreductase [Candidatus Thermoplasmatota archaeon]|nr:LLM class flavin-dependent oxidoreductase [Candidatus Thermoplasmatota archaeon]
MIFDVFFSISQTPVDGACPDEAGMFRAFFEQVEAADRLGYGVAWVAESHLSSEVQKRNRSPVIPHWKGEVGLNCDILQLAQAVFRRTRRIEVGSAVMNILCNGGPVAHAERIAFFLALHGLDPAERRRLHVGFSAGRFDFMNRAYGVEPRTATEKAMPFGLWKGKVFDEAAEVFARLLAGETLNSGQVPLRTVARADFRSDAEWEAVQAAARAEGALDGDRVVLPKRFAFEDLKLVPQEFRRDLLQLVVGSHDPHVQGMVNRFLPAHVANLSITAPAVIEATHQRMRRSFHPAGGPWKRTYMPRTVMVFLNEETGLTPAQRSQAAREESRKALAAYWSALEGTLDPKKVEGAADNAVVGNAEEVAQQLRRYRPDDRLMLWFDFFNHDSARVIRNMEAFMEKVTPLLRKEVAA